MMLSTQMLSICPPRIPQTGTCTQSPVSLIQSPVSLVQSPVSLIQSPVSLVQSTVSLPPWRRRAGLKRSSGFQKGRGRHSTWATKQASPFSSTTEDALDGGVPAKDTGVHDSPGIKTVELVNPIAPTKLFHDQLPPLLSMVVDGLPPFQISKYIDEAEKRLHQYVERYDNVIALDSYYRVGLSSAAYGHPGVISVDRLVAISINYALQFLLDDLFFDTPSEFLQDQYGISRDARGSPQKIQEYLQHLDAVYGQQVEPHNSAPLIETIIWEAGQYTLEMSNPEWFNHYVACVVEHHHGNVAGYEDILQGRNSSFEDVESYAVMRALNIGGKFIQLMVEIADDSYIPGILRTDPYVENLTMTTSKHLGFVNDVFSYHKESLIEQNPYNLISVMLECEGKPFDQTLHMAIDLANTYARKILDLESQAWNPTLRNHMQGIKTLIAGNVYFSFMDVRYRHPDSCFPELRDMTSNWKILPNTKGPGL